MFDLVKLEMDHIKELMKEPINAEHAEWFESGQAELLQKESESFAILINGSPMVCGGIIPLWKGRGYLWTILSEKIKEHSVAVYRGVRLALKEQPYSRLEMDVPVDLDIAHRRAKFLGFSLECARAKKYSPSGIDRSLYAWVRE